MRFLRPHSARLKIVLAFLAMTSIVIAPPSGEAVDGDLDGDGFLDQGAFGPQRVITTAADYAYSVYAADLDGDGDLDVLSASYIDDTIAWYENTDGLGSFGSQQVITTAADYALSVYAADIDGDGDMDVLSASLDDDKIAWYENTDGLGSFSSQQVITTAADGARSVYAADLDGDGDMDVLSASKYDYTEKVAWYENTDGLGSFGTQQVITTAADGARSVYAADLDRDGDMDVLSASRYDDTIAWYENTDGLGNFGDQQVITTAASGAHSVHAADLDSDGDMDVLSASRDDDTIAWYENTDGLGSFGSQQVITTAAAGALSVYAADIDGDGDMDVLSASSADDATIAWYENMDAPQTTGPQRSHHYCGRSVPIRIPMARCRMPATTTTTWTIASRTSWIDGKIALARSPLNLGQLPMAMVYDGWQTEVDGWRPIHSTPASFPDEDADGIPDAAGQLPNATSNADQLDTDDDDDLEMRATPARLYPENDPADDSDGDGLRRFCRSTAPRETTTPIRPTPMTDGLGNACNSGDGLGRR